MKETRADDGCQIAWSTQGDGLPLLFIPGLGGLGAFWAEVISRLTGFRSITFDHRGCGASGSPADGYTIERMASDTVAVLDAAGVERAYIIGHSTGGAIAQVIATTYPERVSRLVLSGTWARPDAHFQMMFESRLEVLERAGAAAYQRLTHVLGLPPEWINAHQAELDVAVARADVTSGSTPIAASRLRMLLGWSGLADLRSIATPTLVVAATDDILIPFHHSEDLARGIARARLIAVTGGHFFPRTDPDGFVAAVEQFLRVGAPAWR